MMMMRENLLFLNAWWKTLMICISCLHCALSKRRFTYSNVDYDHIVGWRTSSIRRQSELAKNDTINEKYPHIVYEEHCKACDAEQCDITEDNSSDKIEVSFNEQKVTLICHDWNIY
ncbi:hypothetical protein Fmac_029477 [Flemingia macrophylla]|uniref:Uncharacterized protein n=1 Tax=Flemingia macrophylla TaxID=520843 RepID=A0ABD1LB02_9FABA